ncbi:maleylpyruvate isomerase N-terminal domain-containing protein [Agromyces salentinus]|uniref:Mycothiol-dependent maleylpyruvate isomerase metal-binding domain-containing protein n=1 Tax=Agromyces salentinus TaxID=269421 RepID=A0ABN2MZX3_9MICO|nr:maleylpyruvate isomerase N-terminal domain-containing protein [Agromyces salentinus]
MTGARTALGGPTGDLLLAYRGTAYFLRWLAQLPERGYDQPGHPAAPADRRTIIATVGYDARGWANLAESLREERPLAATYAPGERAAAIVTGATLPPRALRHLVEHSAVHLAVEWRDLPVAAWNGFGVDDRGAPIAIARTPWLRARQTWLAAVDLGTGGSFSDFPTEVLDRLILETGATITRRGDEYDVTWRDSTLTGTPSAIARRMSRAPNRQPHQTALAKVS